jgi:hypothetical protein
VAEESRRVVGGLDLDQAIVVGSVRGECSTPSELLNQKSSELLFTVGATTAPRTKRKLFVYVNNACNCTAEADRFDRLGVVR